jgi:hypothetical protein
MRERISSGSPPKVPATAPAIASLKRSMRGPPTKDLARAWSDCPRSSGTLEKSAFCRRPFTIWDSMSFLGFE